MSYLIGAMAILHEASIISTILPMKLTDLQGSIGMEGHPRGWLDYLTPLLPDNRRLGLAHALTRQCHILFPRYDKRGAERIYGGANCNRVNSELLSSARDAIIAVIQVSSYQPCGANSEKVFPDGKDLKFRGEEFAEKVRGENKKARSSLTNINTALGVSLLVDCRQFI